MDASPFRSRLGRARSWLDRNAHTFMIASAVAFTLLFSALGILNHWGLRTQLNDLGHIEQALWSLTQGHLSMPVSDPAFESRFVMHSNIILYLVAPLYALLPFSETLLILSALAGAAAGYLLYRLARQILQNQPIALMLGLALLLNPLVQSLVLYDFHVDVLALPLVLLALLFMEKQQPRAFFVTIFLLLTVKEDMPLLVLFLSPFIWKRWSFQIGFGAAVMALTYWIVISGGQEMVLGTTLGSHTFTRFKEFGDTPTEAILYLVTHPWVAVITILTPKKLIYLLMIFLQGGYLAIFSPLFALAAIPNIAQNVLDATNFQSNFTFVYYSGIVITMLYAGVVYSLRKRDGRWGPCITAGLVFFPLQVLAFTYLLSPAPYSQRMYWSDYAAVTDSAALQRILDQIPPDAGVMTHNNLGAHLTQRDVVVQKMKFLDKTDYAVFSVRIPHPRYEPLFFLNPGMRLGGSASSMSNTMQTMFDNQDFGVVDFDPEEALYLFKRGQPRTKNASAKEAFQANLADLTFGPDGVNEALR